MQAIQQQRAAARPRQPADHPAQESQMFLRNQHALRRDLIGLWVAVEQIGHYAPAPAREPAALIDQYVMGRAIQIGARVLHNRRLFERRQVRERLVNDILRFGGAGSELSFEIATQFCAVAGVELRDETRHWGAHPLRRARFAGMMPYGRIRRIEITPDSTSASRYGARLSGRTTCNVTSMTPSNRPPTTAPGRLPSPPTTVAMNAFNTGVNPISGSTEARCAIHNIAPRPANSPESANAVAMMRFAGMPSSRTMSKSSAAARMATPATVFR